MQSRVLVAILATTASAATQTLLVLPAGYARAWGSGPTAGPGSTSGLGGDTSHTQMVFAAPFPIGTPVLGIGLRPTTMTVGRAAFTADVAVLMSSTAAFPGTLSQTFANNVGSDVTVSFPRQVINVRAMPANRTPADFVQILFPTPFVLGTNGNTNLCVELFVYGRSTGAAWSTDLAIASPVGRAAHAGIGCGSASASGPSLPGSYLAGGTFTVGLAFASASALALLIPGFDLVEAAPGVPLPVDLSLYGAGTGCALLVSPGAGSLGFVTNRFGNVSTAITVPAGLGRFGMGWQWVYFGTPTGSNPAGLYTTNNLTTWIGPEVVAPRAQFVWDPSTITATSRYAPTDSVPIVQFLL
jgi:hypothetical protein